MWRTKEFAGSEEVRRDVEDRTVPFLRRNAWGTANVDDDGGGGIGLHGRIVEFLEKLR